MRFWRSAKLMLSLVSLGAGLASGTAQAESPDCSEVVVGLQVENDFFSPAFNDDSDYTNGIRLSFVTPLSDDCVGLGRPARGLAHWLAPDDTVRTTERVGYALGQSMFTPRDTKTTELILDDRPYAAWLYLGVQYQATYEEADGSATQDTLVLEAGVVGPSALGEEAQNAWHELIGVERSNGWHNQLHDEPGLNVSFERKWRSAEARPFAGSSLFTDVIPFAHVTLGNILTYAGVGATVRIGQELDSDFGPPRIRPGLPGSEAFRPDGGIAWYLFAGAEGQAVARNIFLDGNTFRDSHRVDRNPFVGDLQAGLALLYKSWRMTFTHVIRTEEFKEQDDVDHFGAITLSVRF